MVVLFALCAGVLCFVTFTYICQMTIWVWGGFFISLYLCASALKELYILKGSEYMSEFIEPTLLWLRLHPFKVLAYVLIVVVVILVVVLVVIFSGGGDKNDPSLSIAPSSSPPTITYECFGADDGGLATGVLYNSVRSYVDQDCANNKECEIGQKYGWPMNSWCVGNVKDMSYMFSDMDTFNEDISDWNTSSVTDMSYMFAGASLFNGDVSNFDTSSVTTMSLMFQDATAFNGDVSNFNTSSVTTMDSMFEGASSFNQDVSHFDTSSVTDMYQMFYRASSFNKDLCSWQDSFPYTTAYNTFTNSSCTYQDTPDEAQKGPFCASNCQ